MSVRLFRLLSVLTSCFIAQASLGQALAPPLGKATSFALFTAAGAFDNQGPTVVRGDIGTQVGAFTGFPPGTVTGSVHIADAYSGEVAIDVNNAYSYLTTNAPCGSIPIVELGGSPTQALRPGVYCLGGARTLTGELVLDGGGDANAVFIFKIGGALTTADLSTITLLNGATADNVYWQVGGRVDLGTNSVFVGTLLADGAINLLTGAALLGRGLSVAGAISLNNNVVTNSRAVVPLPVTLTAFSATGQGRAVLLQWATASESHSLNFTPERSATGTDGWEAVGTLPAAGSSSSLRQYRMVDADKRHHACYYRLRSTDTNGTQAFSRTQFVAFNAESGPLAAFPNPASGLVTVTGTTPGSILTLVDLAGRVWLQSPAATSEISSLDVSSLSPDIYLLKTVSATGQATSVKLVKK